MINIKPMGLTFDDVLLVPKKTPVASRSNVDLSSHLTPKITLTTPIVSANMDTVTESGMAIEMAKVGGIGIIHRFLSIAAQVAEVSSVKKEGLLVGAAIGIKDDFIERTDALVKVGCDVIVIDIAHGHSEFLLRSLRELKKTFPKTEFVAGNVATAEGAEELIKNGADALKVGIGPGALCTTRIIAGSGVPQITAIMETSEIAKKHSIPVIGDGGIRYSGDIVKALAAGASTVMIGAVLAGCEESPALTFYRNTEKYKLTRGMASLSANYERQFKDTASIKKDIKEYAAEGVEAIVPYRGSVGHLITQFIGGVKSGFSYSGAHNIQELWENAEFIQISQNALIESHPHNVNGL